MKFGHLRSFYSLIIHFAFVDSRQHKELVIERRMALPFVGIVDKKHYERLNEISRRRFASTENMTEYLVNSPVWVYNAFEFGYQTKRHNRYKRGENRYDTLYEIKFATVSKNLLR